MIGFQIAHTLVYNFVFIFTRFVLFYTLGKNLMPSEYGAYALIASLVTLGVYFFGLQLYTYTWREAPGKDRQIGLKLLKSNLIFEVLLILLVVLFLIFTGLNAKFWRWLNFGDYILHFNLALVIIIFSIIFLELKRYLVIIKKIELGNYANFIATLLWVYPLAFLFFIKNTHSILLLLYFWLAGLFIAIVFELVYIGIADIIKAPIDLRNVFKKSLPFSLPLMIPAISFYVMQLLNRYFLAYFKGPEAVGIFSFMFMITNMLYLIGATIFTGVFPPYIIEAHNFGSLERRNSLLLKLLKYPLLLLILLGILLVINSESILNILAKIEYDVGRGLLNILVFYPIMLVLITPAQQILFLHKRTHLTSISFLIGIILYVLLNVLLIPNFSYYGAATAMVVSFGVTCFFVYFFARDINPLKLSDFGLGRITVSILLASLIGHIISSHVHFWGAFGGIFLSSSTVSVVFLGMLILTHGIELEEIKSLITIPKNLFKKKRLAENNIDRLQEQKKLNKLRG